MGPKAKITISAVLIVIVALAVWQLTSPPAMPAIGTKYVQPGQFSKSGFWVEFEKAGSGSLFLGFSIANLTYAREALSTTYSIVISKLNETINSSFVKSFSVRVTGLTIEDNYNGKYTGYDAASSLNDAVQVTSLFTFLTPADHEVRFTVSYDVYNLLFFGYTVDHSQTRSFNITQNIL